MSTTKKSVEKPDAAARAAARVTTPYGLSFSPDIQALMAEAIRRGERRATKHGQIAAERARQEGYARGYAEGHEKGYSDGWDTQMNMRVRDAMEARGETSGGRSGVERQGGFVKVTALGPQFVRKQAQDAMKKINSDLDAIHSGALESKTEVTDHGYGHVSVKSVTIDHRKKK